MLKTIAAILTVSLASIAAAGHSRHENAGQQEVGVKIQKITDNLHLLQGRGGNVAALAGPEGILIVDDDYANVSEKLAAALKTLGSEKPRYIFNTHWHGDHTEGNKFFGKDSIIISHINVRKRLAVDAVIFGQKFSAFPLEALPEIAFDNSLSVFFNGEEIRATHLPNGHTDGDSIVYFQKANTLHMGDDYFFDRFPFVDVDSGGSVKGLAKNIGEVLSWVPKDAKIIPGHGPMATPEDLKRYHEMLNETIGIIEDGIKKQKTLADLKKEGFPEKYKSWGTGFIKPDFWIETIHKSLMKK